MLKNKLFLFGAACAVAIIGYTALSSNSQQDQSQKDPDTTILIITEQNDQPGTKPVKPQNPDDNSKPKDGVIIIGEQEVSMADDQSNSKQDSSQDQGELLIVSDTSTQDSQQDQESVSEVYINTDEANDISPGQGDYNSLDK